MANGTPAPNGWSEWSKYVLKELDRLNTCLTEVNNNVTEIKVEIATLKVKSGLWGAAAGTIPVVIAIAIALIKGFL